MPNSRRLKWLPDALRDLQRLHRFLHSNSPAAANRAIERIVSAAELLLEHPEMGKPYAPTAGYRELSISFGSRGYILRYRIDADDIVLVRVWHALEDR